MKRPLLRFAAACCSFGLIAAYVVHRSGAQEKILPSSKVGRVTHDLATEQTATTQVVLPGSKSGAFVITPTESPNLQLKLESAPPATTAPRLYLPGSKGALITVTPAPPTTLPAPSTKFSLQP